MKVNEHRMRMKALYTDMNSQNTSIHGLASNYSQKRNLGQFRTLEDNPDRANTSNDVSVIKFNNKRADINSAYGVYKYRDNVSTRGGLSNGGRSEFQSDGGQYEPPFLFLNDQETLQRFISKQRKMVSSVSSKYLNYNTAGRLQSGMTRDNQDSPPKLDGVSTILGESHKNDHKLNNFNEYQHVYIDPKSNEANVSWITKLRDYDISLFQSMKGGDPEKQSNRDSSPPSVFFKGKSENQVKRVADFDYPGNHLDVVHLSTNRLGPTPNISQVHFETGLRKYNSSQHLHSLETQDHEGTIGEITSQKDLTKRSKIHSMQQSTPKNGFVTIFPKSKSLLTQYGPSFLPPIKQQAQEQYDRLEVIQENAKTLLKGDNENKDGIKLYSAFDPQNKSMPKFTDKIKTAHDYNQIRHLLKSNKKMSQVLWELSLRPELYINQPSSIQEPNDSGKRTTKNRKDIKFFSQPKAPRKKRDQ